MSTDPCSSHTIAPTLTPSAPFSTAASSSSPPAVRYPHSRRSMPGTSYTEVASDPGFDSDDYLPTTSPEPEEEPLPERGTGTGKSLRPRASLGKPEGSEWYVDSETILSRGRNKRSTGNGVKGGKIVKKAKVKVNGNNKVKKVAGSQRGDGLTARAEIRKTLEETKRKRDRFFVKYEELFKPLLGERNYISKMVEKQREGNEEQAEKEAEEMNTARIEVRDGNEGEKQPEAVTDIETAQPPPQLVNGNEGEKQPEEAVADIESAQPPPPQLVDDVVPYKLLDKQPEHVMGTMKPYQLSGLSFLVWLYNNGASGILGDEMGLGKTLQTLSLFSYLTTYKPAPEGHQRPFLVVCPLSVLSSWISECKRWTPHLRVIRFHGPVTERSRLKKQAEMGEDGHAYDVVVTSYEVFDREKTWFQRAFVWRYVVLDEGHKIKNEKTNIATSLQGLAAEYRLILSGTPLQNNLGELWALLHWLYPDVFPENTRQLFYDAFNLTLGKNDLSVIDGAKRLLELVMLRRLKESKGVDLDLPKKTEVVMYLPLTPMQRFWYKRLLTRVDKGLLEGLFRTNGESEDATTATTQDTESSAAATAFSEEWNETRQLIEQQVSNARVNESDNKWRKLMNLLMQLRKCCNHPFLLPNAEPEDSSDHASSLILASSKMIFLDKLLEELCINQGKKVLIFSTFTKMLDICEDFMYLKGGDGSRFKFDRLDGGTARARRNLAIRLFNSDPEYKVLLISTGAGGLGINLTSASNVVMLDTDWNPQVDLQAQARAHRIGQVNPVTVYRLITQGTVEEQMMGRILKKLYLSAKVTESMRDIRTIGVTPDSNPTTCDNLPTLSTSQLISLVRYGSRAIARPEISPTDMLHWSWDTMVEKCREYEEAHSTDDLEKGTANSEAAERAWLSELERVQSRVFEGRVHTSLSSTNRDIAQSWTRESRRLGMERVVMINGHSVLKDTVGNAEWEAVKTLAGSDPRLAEPPKTKRASINHQDYCQICFDGGVLVLCSGCPRAYHDDCLPISAVFGGGLGSQFYCPQHQCRSCEQKTANAGGLIYRCRWCEAGYCEDCLEWEDTELVGDRMVEYDLLRFEQTGNAFFINCKECRERHAEDKVAREMCEEMVQGWELMVETEDGLTMGGTTVEGSGVNTPREEDGEVIVSMEEKGVQKDGKGVKKGRKRRRTLTMQGKKKKVKVQ
ncbi:SNF2 family N-terminal domain-containing protein [Trichophaea hybrida]|nr:SNF2 family N-terminal domain-containing protein [Trichophaea hybrida]